jgi:hypothetical protein
VSPCPRLERRIRSRIRANPRHWPCRNVACRSPTQIQVFRARQFAALETGRAATWCMRELLDTWRADRQFHRGQSNNGSCIFPSTVHAVPTYSLTRAMSSLSSVRVWVWWKSQDGCITELAPD